MRGEKWFPSLEERGRVIVRSIADEPDEDFEKRRRTLLAALPAARLFTPFL